MHVDKKSNMLFFLVIQTVYGGSKDNKNFFLRIHNPLLHLVFFYTLCELLSYLHLLPKD